MSKHGVLHPPEWLCPNIYYSCVNCVVLIDTDWLIRRLCRQKLTVISSCVDTIGWNLPWMAAVLALLTEIGSDWRLCQLCWLWLILIGTCVLLSIKIDPDWFMIRFCWAWLNLIDSGFDSVDTDFPWLAQMSTFSTEFDPDMLMCRLCLYKLTLISSCVNLIVCGWAQLAQVSSVSSLTDPDCLIYRLSVNWNCSWYAQVSKLSSLSTVINFDWLICLFCRLWLTLTGVCAKCVDCDWTCVDCVDTDRLGSANFWLCRMKSTLYMLMGQIYWMKLTLVSTCDDSVYCYWPLLFLDSILLTMVDPDFLMCQHGRMLPTLFPSFVDNVDWDWPWSSHVSTWSCLIHTDQILCRLCLQWSTLFVSCAGFVDCDRSSSAHL